MSNKSKKPFNPFYPVLLVLGAAFAITACAYGVMAVNFLNPAQVNSDQPAGGLLAFLDRHGVTLLVVELILLAAAAFAAIGTDDYWTRRAERRDRHDQSGDASRTSSTHTG